ncbi:hepatitis A virus cellular receptor 2-like [Hyla sarda]|uniref:hepatitis A virus cellular receptor 2-like n=1 Tax=Hyla sarda TaxID=327740 RepID=UPI0024C45A5B|nr:hepatitis A virus cellular receptor 2-like [Hyla sarda]XP_056373342.1 hepatitis A virus cellular receptor 2-like [Hyla sarda]
MIFLYTLTTSLITIYFSGVTTAREDITGFVNDTVTLPCTYSPRTEATEVCWRKANCSKSTCRFSFLRTNGSSVIKRNSVRYKLLGDITQGDASLTITRLIMSDKGTYCCEVVIPGPYNGVKTEINVQVFETPVVIGSLDNSVILPCKYSTTEGLTQLCWGRGDCSNLRLCSDAILRTNGSKIIKRTSNRYELLGNLVEGNASLTITSLTMEDEGIYCCKVIIPGPANDVSRERTLQILTKRLNWNTTGNVIRGIMIFLVPIIVLLIYKCGSL